MKRFLLTLVFVSISPLAFTQVWDWNSNSIRSNGEPKQTNSKAATNKRQTKKMTVANQRTEQKKRDDALAAIVAQQVQQQDSTYRAESKRAEKAKGNHKITMDKNDPRVLYMNGTRYNTLDNKDAALRVPLSEEHGFVRTTRYVSPDNQDTIFVDRGSIPKKNERFPIMGKSSSRELLQGTNEDPKDEIKSCVQTRADGSCVYTVQRQTRLPESGPVQVTVKRNIPAIGAKAQANVMGGTYQSVKNTDIKRVIIPSSKVSKRGDVYGPETYFK